MIDRRVQVHQSSDAHHPQGLLLLKPEQLHPHRSRKADKTLSRCVSSSKNHEGGMVGAKMGNEGECKFKGGIDTWLIVICDRELRCARAGMRRILCRCTTVLSRCRWMLVREFSTSKPLSYGQRAMCPSVSRFSITVSKRKFWGTVFHRKFRCSLGFSRSPRACAPINPNQGAGMFPRRNGSY